MNAEQLEQERAIQICEVLAGRALADSPTRAAMLLAIEAIRAQQQAASAAPVDPDIPDGALGQAEPFHSIGLKWIRYARTTYDANDIAVAVWSAMAEVRTLSKATADVMADAEPTNGS